MLVYRAIVDCARCGARAANVGTIGLRSNPAEQAPGQGIRKGSDDTTRNDKIRVRANRTERQPTAHRVLPGGSIPGIPAMEGAEGCCRAPAADDPPIGSRFELMSDKMPGLITWSAETRRKSSAFHASWSAALEPLHPYPIAGFPNDLDYGILTTSNTRAISRSPSPGTGLVPNIDRAPRAAQRKIP